MAGDFSWSAFYEHRKGVRRAFPSVYKLKVKKKLLDVVTEELSGVEKILDVGAHTRDLGERIKRERPGVGFKTMDLDREKEHDYYSLDCVDEKFDIVILAEVIEHLGFEEGMELLKKLYDLLAPGGKIIVSTPNLHHPNRYWDSDHKTPYRYEEISGALVSVGFEAKKIYRIYNDSFLKRLLRLYVMAPLHSYLDVDFAKSIVVVAARR